MISLPKQRSAFVNFVAILLDTFNPPICTSLNQNKKWIKTTSHQTSTYCGSRKLRKFTICNYVGLVVNGDLLNLLLLTRRRRSNGCSALCSLCFSCFACCKSTRFRSCINRAYSCWRSSFSFCNKNKEKLTFNSPDGAFTLITTQQKAQLSTWHSNMTMKSDCTTLVTRISSIDENTRTWHDLYHLIYLLTYAYS